MPDGDVLVGISFKEDDLYYAVCVNRYLMTVAQTEADLEAAIRDMVDTHVEACREEGRVPFVGLPKAPERFWTMWVDWQKGGASVRLIEGSNERPHLQLLQAAA